MIRNSFGRVNLENHHRNVYVPLVPQAPSANASKQISPERKAEIGRQIKRGEFTEGMSKDQDENKGLASYSTIVKGFKKTAEASSIGSSWSGGSDTVRQGPEAYSPLWLTSNTHLPRDKQTVNAWARAFFALHPIVNNAISLHSTYPISKLNITCPNKEIETFFNEMSEEMDLMNACVQMAQEFFCIGEVFPYLELDDENLKWKRVMVQNPDYVSVNKTPISSEPEISLKPDMALRQVIFGNDRESSRIRSQIPPEIVKYVKAGKNIPLSNMYISHLARKINPYDTRGTSLIAPAFKALMLWDKLRECKYAQADNLINPITVVKLGGTADPEYKINEADLLHWRQLLEEAQYDKNFKIITHGSVDISFVGGGAAVLDINADIQQLTKEIYIALMVPQVVMDGGGDITYNNGSLSLDVLRQRYMQFQNMMSKWIKTKVFAPIAQLNDFFDYSGKEKKLIIPNVEWNHMNLFDVDSYINVLTQLAGERKAVSVQTLYVSLGLDYEEERRKIRQECIDEAILKREQEILSRMDLAQLRTLTSEEEIKDLPDSKVPGESADEEPVAGEAADGMGGLGDMSGGLGGGLGAPPSPEPMPAPEPAPAPAPAPA